MHTALEQAELNVSDEISGTLKRKFGPPGLQVVQVLCIPWKTLNA